MQRTDLVALVSRRVALRRSGSGFMGLCPFHNEKTPSFSVSPDKQLYYCFGCGKGGNAFRFLMDLDGYSFPEAVELLAGQAGLTLPERKGRPAGEEERRRRQLQLLQQAADAFVAALREAPHARRYLEGERGMPPAIIERYAIGYAPPGYGFMRRRFGAKREVQRLLAEVGLISDQAHGGGDRFRDRIIFPIRDRRGRIVGFGGRSLGEGKPKYLNTAETALFHKSSLLYGLAEHREEIRKARRLIVVEGYMDVLALAAHGLPQGVAPLGTAIGDQQIRAVLQLCSAPLFCFDGDQAGRNAAWRALTRMMPLLGADHAPHFLFLPEGEDPDSLLRREGAEGLQRRIGTNARSALQYWIDGLRRSAGGGVEGRARMARQAHEMLSTMGERYLAQVWRQEAERAVGIAIAPGPRATAVERRPARSPRDLARTLGARFLKALLQRPERFVALEPQDGTLFLDNDRLQSIYTRAFSAREHHRNDPAGIVRELAAAFPETREIPAWSMHREPIPAGDPQKAEEADDDTIEEHEYQAILATLRMEQIQRRLRGGGISLDESIALQRRLRELSRQRRAYDHSRSTERAPPPLGRPEG